MNGMKEMSLIKNQLKKGFTDQINPIFRVNSETTTMHGMGFFNLKMQF